MDGWFILRLQVSQVNSVIPERPSLRRSISSRNGVWSSGLGLGPHSSSLFCPQMTKKRKNVLENRMRRAKDRRIEHYNQTTHQLPAFNVGDHVLIQHPLTKCWGAPGIIVECGVNRDYWVKTPTSCLFRRNRCFLRCWIPVFPGQPGPCRIRHPPQRFPEPEQRIKFSVNLNRLSRFYNRR